MNPSSARIYRTDVAPHTIRSCAADAGSVHAAHAPLNLPLLSQVWPNAAELCQTLFKVGRCQLNLASFDPIWSRLRPDAVRGRARGRISPVRNPERDRWEFRLELGAQSSYVDKHCCFRLEIRRGSQFVGVPRHCCRARAKTSGIRFVAEIGAGSTDTPQTPSIGRPSPAPKWGDPVAIFGPAIKHLARSLVEQTSRHTPCSEQIACVDMFVSMCPQSSFFFVPSV